MGRVASGCDQSGSGSAGHGHGLRSDHRGRSGDGREMAACMVVGPILVTRPPAAVAAVSQGSVDGGVGNLAAEVSGGVVTARAHPGGGDGWGQGHPSGQRVVAGLEARVHPTVWQVPYIYRDLEELICGHLRQSRPVLLVGSSMVGKTRMAAQVIIREFGDRPG